MRRTTLIFTASRYQASAAINYQASHPHETVRFISCDISSILYFNRKKIDHTPVFKLLSPPNANLHAYKLPYRLTRTFLSHPQIKSQLQLGPIDLTVPLTEMLRFKLLQDLEKIYLLNQVFNHIPCRKIVVSSDFIPPLPLKIFSRTKKIQLVDLDDWLAPADKLRSIFERQWLNLLQEIKTIVILVRRPLVTLRALLHPPRRNLKFSGSRQKSIVVFSNGLNLASYHSVFTNLKKRAHVHVFTGQQSLLDRFYLSLYRQFNTLELDFAHPDIVRRTVKLTRQLSHLSRELQLPHLSNLKLPPGLRFTPTMVNQLLHHNIQFLINYWLVKFLRFYAAADFILHQLKPKMVITTHDPGPTGVAFTLAAKKQHLPTVVLLHGSPSHIHFFFSDHQVIWGPLMKQLLVSAGESSRKLILGGHPLYYDYLQYFRKFAPACGAKFTIGIITSGFGGHEAHQLQFFLTLLPQLADLKSPTRILIRSHATQKLDSLKQWAHQLGLLDVIINPPLLLEEVVARSDLIITQDSTAALVPLVATKPTIAVPLWSPLADRGYVLNSPAFFTLKPKTSLHQLIDTILDNPLLTSSQRRLQQRYLDQYCGPIDAKIGHRIAHQLEQLL